jgi:hypothetical protein
MKESQGPDVFDSSIDQSPLLIVEDTSSSSDDASCEMNYDASPNQHTPTWQNPYSSTKITSVIFQATLQPNFYAGWQSIIASSLGDHTQSSGP